MTLLQWHFHLMAPCWPQQTLGVWIWSLCLAMGSGNSADLSSSLSSPQWHSARQVSLWLDHRRAKRLSGAVARESVCKERIQLITIWSGKQLGLQFGRCSAGLTFDDSSQFLALGDVFGKVRIIAAERGTEVAVFTAGDRCAVDAVAFQPGTTLLVCATNRTILAWNVAADCSQQVWTVTLDRQSLKSLAWGAMGLTLAVACVEGVQVFDVTTGAPRVQAQMEHRDVRALNPRVGVAMSFDERPLIAYACRTRPLELLLCPSAPRWSLAEHKGWIRANNHVADYVEFIMMLAHRLALSEAADGLVRIPALPLEMWCGILSFLSAFDMRSHCY
eukprot:m.241340 g.241340  ORF g.241340 m.241340 type:complete len:332 (+) comp15827_c0_seq18:100-1095(+)